MSDLTRCRDHCRKQADNDDQPAAWSQLWRMLADEVDRYLAREESDVETEPMWPEDAHEGVGG
jgi:hypothetical protein